MAHAFKGIGNRVSALRDVFSVRAFRLFSIANFASLNAIWIVRTTAAWLTWEMTHSKTWLGVIAFAELGPSVLISGFAGVLADRHDRLGILRFGQSIQMTLALLLAGLVIFKSLTVWWLVAILVIYSLVAGLTLPARLAAGPSLAGRERLATASAIVSITLNVTRFVGPLIAAPLLAINFEVAAFALAAAGFALNTWCLGQITPEESAAASPGKAAGDSGADYLTVLRELLMMPGVAAVLSLQLMTSMLVRPLIDMFPAYADRVFRLGEAGYGGLSAAVGFGAVFGAVYMVGQTAGMAMRTQIVAGSAVFAGSMLAFAYCETFVLALGLLLVFGMAMTISGVASTSFVQSHTPMDRLGRVMSLYSVIARLAPAIGALGLGFLADTAGLTPVVTLFALLALACIVVAHRRLPR